MPFSSARSLYLSKAVSDVTSEVYWVGDAEEITLQLPSTSATTVQASNDDGRSAAITNWSNLTTATAAGMLNIEPGFRWLRLLSTKTDAILNLQQRT